MNRLKNEVEMYLKRVPNSHDSSDSYTGKYSAI